MTDAKAAGATFVKMQADPDTSEFEGHVSEGEEGEAYTPPVGVSESSREATRSDRRQDRRADRRIESDRRRRREPGGDSSSTGVGSHFQSDWAGRTILENYLTGGEDLDINNDPRWTEYMKSSPVLRSNMEAEMTRIAQELAATGQAGTIAVNETLHTNMENGEGIIGHHYLHGTNANVGDYQIQGTANVIRSGNTTIVDFDIAHTWNDVIDPNPKYGTDTIKSTVAEVLTLGRADPYDISITWDAKTQVELDSTGNVPPKTTGWPGK